MAVRARHAMRWLWLQKKYVRTAGDLEKLRAETVAMSDPQGSLVRTRSLRKSHGASPLFFQGE